MGIQLLKHQEEGRDFVNLKKHVFLAMGTGTGKTYTALSALYRNSVIICTEKQSKAQWLNSIETYYPEGYDHKIEVYTYYEAGNLSKFDFDVDTLIYDEVQTLSSNSKRTRNMKKLLKSISPEIIMALSATPIRHTESDIYSIVSNLNMDIPLTRTFKSMTQFKQAFFKQEWGFNFYTQKMGLIYTEMNESLVSTMYSYVPRFSYMDTTRFKSNEYMVKLTKPEMDKYELCEKHNVIWGHYSTLAAAPKLSALHQMANSTFKMNSGEPILMDNDYLIKVEKIKEIAKHHGKALIVYNFEGEANLLMHHLKATTSIKKFEKGGYDFLLRQASKARSIDMYCQTMIFFTLNYSAENFEQMKGRITRANASYDEVFYYYLIFENTIETELWKIVQGKKTKNDVLKMLK